MLAGLFFLFDIVAPILVNYFQASRSIFFCFSSGVTYLILLNVSSISPHFLSHFKSFFRDNRNVMFTYFIHIMLSKVIATATTNRSVYRKSSASNISGQPTMYLFLKWEKRGEGTSIC